jgi:hypothetical protein
LNLRRSRVTTESIADLHTVIMHSIVLRRKHGKQQPLKLTRSI